MTFELHEQRPVTSLIEELEFALGSKLVKGRLRHIGIRGPLELEGSIKGKGTLKQCIEEIIHDFNVGKQENLQVGLLRLMQLLTDLKTLARIDKTLAATFRKKYKSISDNEYNGWRFELATAAHFILEHIPFNFHFDGMDSIHGDFTLTNATPPLTVECTTATIAKLQFSTFLHKISSAITAKGRKAYASDSCVLFLDATSIFYQRGMMNEHLGAEELRKALRNEVSNMPFASVFVWSYYLDRNSGSIGMGRGWFREDNPGISDSSKEYLDKNFSTREITIKPVGYVPI